MTEFLLESDFQDWLLKKLRKIPRSKWIKVNDKVTSGIPDIHGSVNGFYVTAELKIPGNNATPLQAYNILEYQQTGARAYVLYPKDSVKFIKEMYALSKIKIPSSFRR